MDKIIVPFEDIRGLGNIIITKNLDEYEKISCELIVDDDIFTLTPLFFKLGFKKTSTKNYSTQLYTNTNLTVDASVNYNNESVNDPFINPSTEKISIELELIDIFVLIVLRIIYVKIKRRKNKQQRINKNIIKK